MKKFRLSLIIVLTLVAVLIPTQFAFAAKTADVLVTVTATKVSITVYNGTTGTTAAGVWKPNLIQLDYASSHNDGIAYDGQATQANSGAAGTGWHVRNTGGTQVDITWKANNLPNTSTKWTLAAGPLDDISGNKEKYALWWVKTAASGGWTNFADTTPITFEDNVGTTADTSEFWLSIQAPPDWDDADVPPADTAVVTFTAAKG